MNEGSTMTFIQQTNTTIKTKSKNFDCIVIGSGFGGSVSALRLAEKGYRVLVIEKGRWYKKPKDFPNTNWNLPKWMWLPQINFRGPFKMSFFRHVTIMSGVGVGGGSLVYANTLPVPKDSFFEAKSWGSLANWKIELSEHYKTAQKMLGATTNNYFTKTDSVFKEIAADIGRADSFHPVDVGVFLGKPGKTVKDPFFDGKGPDRKGCIYCGGCMLGCQHNAKNSLDKNYLHLSIGLGTQVKAETNVTDVTQLSDGSYQISASERLSLFRKKDHIFNAKKVIFAGGVLGTVPLLLKLKATKSLPLLSSRLGQFIRTNNEAIIGVTSHNGSDNFTEGLAISSIIHTSDDSHLEPVRYPPGSGFFRILLAPHAPGKNVFIRISTLLRSWLKNPIKWLKVMTVKDFAKSSQILLYMQSLDGTLSFKMGRNLFTFFRKGMISKIERGAPPAAFMKEATKLSMLFAQKTSGMVQNLFTETLFNIPSTAHILGGCCMGKDTNEGVINHKHEVFGYKNMYIIDGSSMSANPGVNPSLTITAMSERAMSFIPTKPGAKQSDKS